MGVALITHSLADLGHTHIGFGKQALCLLESDAVEIFHKGKAGGFLKYARKIAGADEKLVGNAV